VRSPTPIALAPSFFALLCGVLCLLGTNRMFAADFPRWAENGALRLTVEGLRVTETYGETSAPVGRVWLVVRGRWENRIDRRRASERELPIALEVGELAKHLYAVIDGASLGSLRALEGVGGRRSLAGVTLAKPGDFVAGDMVFEIPAGAYSSAELQFYDDTTGHLRLALAGVTPEAKPPGLAVRNAVAEFALFAVSDPALVQNSAAVPVGSRAVAVELRARSLWRTVGPAPSYDFSLPAGAQVERVNLLDWPETQRSFVLVADGEYAAMPVGGTLPSDARFLPGVFTGGTMVFHVPAESESLELVGTLGRASTEAGVMDVTPVRLSVRAVPAKAKAAEWTMPLRLADEMFGLGIAARRLSVFAGESAGPSQEFVVLDVGVQNTSSKGEYFQPEAQLQLLDPEAGLLTCDEIAERGPRRPYAEIHVPAGERRRCELVFRVAKGAALKLNFRGGSSETQHELP